MTMLFSITGKLNNLLALTQLERLKASGRLGSDAMADHFFTILGTVAIVLLTILFFVVEYQQKRKHRTSNQKLFSEYTIQRGLTEKETQMLLDVTVKAGLKQPASIFTMDKVFNKVVARLGEDCAKKNTAGQTETLKSDFAVIAEKLGFGKAELVPGGLSLRSTILSSRQIAAGKKVYVSCKAMRQSDEVEAVVEKNSSEEFVVRLSHSMTITFGDCWSVRYYFGASVWQFDTSVISYDGGLLSLKHSDKVRYVNRRRFVRVPVRKEAYIAEFPFEKPAKNGDQNAASNWQPPKFTPAIVTEIGGPGLRIETSQNIQVGQRILVTFNLASDSEEGAEPMGILGDMGQVRDVRQSDNGSSIAVELTGLNDSNIAELIRITNSALLRRNKITKQLSSSNKSKVLETVGV
jgi:hypothetical protein